MQHEESRELIKLSQKINRYVDKLESSQNILQHVAKTFPNLEKAQQQFKNLNREDSTSRDRIEFQKIIEQSIILDLVDKDKVRNPKPQTPLKHKLSMDRNRENSPEQDLNESWDRLHDLLLTN